VLSDRVALRACGVGCGACGAGELSLGVSPVARRRFLAARFSRSSRISCGDTRGADATVLARRDIGLAPVLGARALHAPCRRFGASDGMGRRATSRRGDGKWAF